jgi:iron only hydrogenase large subunit-like protein
MSQWVSDPCAACIPGLIRLIAGHCHAWALKLPRMDSRSPVFTDEAECQDCYKCLRACPVKAISVSAGHAQVRAESCIACGRCVAACPPKAKRVRDDLDVVRRLVATGQRIAVSLAPSWVAEFPDLQPGQMVAALRALGFALVSETALGARAVSAAVAQLREKTPDRLWLSTACPSATDFIRKHRPHLLAALTPLASPALTHARMLHLAEPGCQVVLISPCVAKKREADEHPELLAAAITFADVRRWWNEAGIVPGSLPEAESFALGAAGEAALYPVEGGLLTGVRRHGRGDDPGLAACSGIADLDLSLAGLSPDDGAMFVETLACVGGCVNGPGMTPGGFVLKRRATVLERPRQGDAAPAPVVPTALDWPGLPVPADAIDDRAMTEALARTGKRGHEDELNCSGCGYETCRDFARALVAGRAEPNQCVTWMRRLAQRKANALLAAMPAGAVLVDRELRVIECNQHFAQLTGVVERCVPGAQIGDLVPFARLFRHVLDGHGDVLERDFKLGGRVVHGSVFTVDAGQVVGAVLADVTEPAMGRAQVASRAKEAIEKHLATVQRIAYLLGENAAETEGLLSQIVDAYKPEAGDGSR